MTNSTIGLITGLLLTLAIVAGGFTGLLLALILGGAGYAIGGHVDGEFDLSAITRGRRG